MINVLKLVWTYCSGQEDVSAVKSPTRLAVVVSCNEFIADPAINTCLQRKQANRTTSRPY